MKEQRNASYFEVVDLIEQILPAKSELDYAKISPDDLVKRFDEAVTQSGYNFSEVDLEAARYTLRTCFENVYGRNSFLLGGKFLKEPAPGYDQNNYNIQNQLSKAKSTLIYRLGNGEQLPDVWNGTINTRLLGNVSDLRTRMTRDNIRAYISSVVTSTWENGQVIKPEAAVLAYDILGHFGIKTSNGSKPTEICDKLIEEIESLEFASKRVYGIKDREGYYEGASTIPELYSKEIEKTIDTIAGYIYDMWVASIDREAERERSTPITIEQEPVEEISTFEEPLVETEVSTEELEEPIKKYEELQSIIQENIQLEEEIRMLKEKITAIESKIVENNSRMKSLL